MTVKLLTEQHLEFLSLKGGYTGWSESKLVNMPHCWKSHVAAQSFWFLTNCADSTHHDLNGIDCLLGRTAQYTLVHSADLNACRWGSLKRKIDVIIQFIKDNVSIKRFRLPSE